MQQQIDGLKYRTFNYGKAEKRHVYHICDAIVAVRISSHFSSPLPKKEKNIYGEREKAAYRDDTMHRAHNQSVYIMVGNYS